MGDAMDRGRAFAETLGIARSLARSQRAIDFGQRGVEMQHALVQRLIGVGARQGRAAQRGGAGATQAVLPGKTRDAVRPDQLDDIKPGEAIASAQADRGSARPPGLAGGAFLQNPRLKLNLGISGGARTPGLSDGLGPSLRTTHAAPPVAKLAPPLAGYDEPLRQTPGDKTSRLLGQTRGVSGPTYGGRSEIDRQPPLAGAKVFSVTAQAGEAAKPAQVRMGQQSARSMTRAALAHIAAEPVTHRRLDIARAPNATAPFERAQDHQGSTPPFAQSGATTSQEAGATQSSAPSGATDSGPGPTEGDVYLDGTLLGRWMARTLSAQASRPASGGAGFDLRRGVFPTGAMIGG